MNAVTEARRTAFAMKLPRPVSSNQEKRDKGYGDLVAVELRQEFPHGHQLNRNGRHTGPYDRPRDEYFQRSLHAGVLLRETINEMTSPERLQGLV